MKALSLHIEKYIRVWLTAAIIFCGVISVSAKPETKHLASDSSNVSVREPDKNSQENYYNDEYYKYERDKTQTKEEPDVFDRLWTSFWDKIWDSFKLQKDNRFNPWSIFWILLIVIIIVLVVLKLTNSGVSGIFSGKNKVNEEGDATLEDVNIHSINYEEQIHEALSKNDYRLAVRLWFLRTLKSFSDRELVHWKIDKTNSDYYYELSGTDYQKDFGEISKVYDYIWYGEFPVDENSYKMAEEKFRGLYGRVQ